MTDREIRRQYPNGLLTPHGYPGCGAGSITDDTQQALAVCRGLLHGKRRGGSDDQLVDDIWFQLKQWYKLQMESPSERRAPGMTSMSALANMRSGSMHDPLNDSRSCGAVMRAHPIGLVCAGQPVHAFQLGCRVGALTHGHPDGYGPSGVLAATIAGLLGGQSIENAAHEAALILAMHVPDAVRTGRWLSLALSANPRSVTADLNAGAEGWEGDEALAIGLLAARRHPTNLHQACEFAAIHDGDSDSTASIAGAIVGCALGVVAIPPPWEERLEHAQELTQRGNELAAITLG
jgi:ADP-ribosylglycohydrolase